MTRALILLPGLLAGFAAAQQVVWTRTFLDSSYGPTISADTRGNMVVAAGPLVRKYGPNGDSLWVRRLDVHHPRWLMAATDREDNILLGHYNSDTSWGVTRLSPNGDIDWTWQTDWPRSPAYPFTAIAADHRNHPLITGYRRGTYESMWFTYRLTPDGRTDWLRTFTSTWGPDAANAVCADSRGHVLVGGCQGIPYRNRQWYPSFIKYSPTGESLAGKIYIPNPDSSPAACLVAISVAADPEGNILLAGSGTIYSYGGPGTHWSGTFLFKYGPDGDTLWRWFSEENDTAGYSRWTGHQFERAYSCRADTAGNVYLVRPIYMPSDSTFAAELRKFRPDGELAWVLRILDARLPAHPSIYSPVLSLALCPQGNLIIAGRVSGLSDTAYIIKVNPSAGVYENPGPEFLPGPWLPATIRAGSDSRMPDSLTAVYDIRGRLVWKYGMVERPALPAGVYFVTLESGGHKVRQKVVLQR